MSGPDMNGPFDPNGGTPAVTVRRALGQGGR
ncbi:hypothetical protein SAMN04489712_12179 [Thermomonospora echinospora]|uniref:Uncharacterized protein n=1 Tax=Thermomonospora echinospora TaxID=1992 RepID=A0A1H6DU45_9ACTN|nr:hypothetical protein SAMN04489712_12179 [Thermomonospora echinospora]